MYRHPRLAAETQIDSLRVDLRDAARRLELAERERESALAELDRMREGISHDPTLPTDLAYRRTQLGLRSLAVVGALLVSGGVVALLAWMIAPPMISWQGVLNLGWHLRNGAAGVGLASAGGIVLLTSPWLVLPWIGALGLRRQRRWGWFLSVASAALYLPTPLMPVSVYAMTVLWSGRVRAVYFPR